THHCLVYDPKVRENPVLEFHSDLSTWQFTEYRNVSPKEFSFAEVSSATPSLNICNYVPATSGTLIKINGRKHDAVTCQKSLTDDVESIKCVLSLLTEDGDKSPCFDIAGDLNTAFWACLGLRTAADAFFICAFCLLEGVTLRTIQNGPYNRGAYGRSRMVPAIALVIFPPVVGSLVDYFSEVADTPDYSPAYFIFAACELIACILIYALPLPVGGNTFRYDLSSDYSTRNYGEGPSRKFEISLELIVISIVTTLLGTAWSVSQVFDPLLYQDIHFTHLMLGASQSAVFLFAVPFLWVSKNLIQNIGESNLISTAFAFHSLHLAGLSFTDEWRFWWWSTPFETMKAFTIPLLWLALVAAVEHDSSKGKRIAMHYVLAVTHFGIGRILGCSIVGFVAEKYSMSLSYRAMSAFCLVMSILYLLFHHCFMKPRHRKKVAERCALQRQSVNGSCLLLVETMPVNGRIVPATQN
ncbi:MFS_1_like domain-containing protein, partial [Nephila pilipes]